MKAEAETPFARHRENKCGPSHGRPRRLDLLAAALLVTAALLPFPARAGEPPPAAMAGEGAVAPPAEVSPSDAPASDPAATVTIVAPTGVSASDIPDDAGNSIAVTWKKLEPEPEGVRYVIERSTAASGDAEWARAGETIAGSERFTDSPAEKGEPLLTNGKAYRYRVIAELAGNPGRGVSEATPPVAPEASLFNGGRTWVLVFLVVFISLTVVLIELTKKGRPVFIRPIAGLKALEEAVGRATEMGKPVFFMPGIDEANNIQTLFGMVILGHVTRLVARYETPLIVVVGKAFVVPLAQETVKQGFIDAGRPELYKPEIVRYYSDEQFATVTAITGIFLRERPATNLFFGSFYAESLVLAETGFLTGAVQIAGTGNIHQLPFFVVSCDYTLVGEEFFAVSAYLSKEPKLLGSLKAMDLTKVLILGILTVGFVLATVAPELGARMAHFFTIQ